MYEDCYSGDNSEATEVSSTSVHAVELALAPDNSMKE